LRIGVDNSPVSKPRTILSEPAGPTYLDLLRFAENRATTFSLVWREQLNFEAAAKDVEARLRPFLQKRTRTSEWPGTELIGHFAIVRFYHLTRKAAEIVASAERLYAWMAPDRPEDLAFYAADGRCWLASIAHERESFLDLDPPELSAFCTAVPGLRLSV
jgi:hypothetical protein